MAQELVLEWLSGVSTGERDACCPHRHLLLHHWLNYKFTIPIDVGQGDSILLDLGEVEVM